MAYKIVVGIPSYNESKRIDFVVQQVDLGLVKFFNSRECLIVNIDSKSPDDTKSAFLKTRTKCKKLYMSTGRGKGRALIDFWNFALSNNARVIATVDADISSITPEWIGKLLKPVVDKKYDVVAPVYTRNRFAAGVTNHFAYPLVYSIYGIELRQPLAGEYAYTSSFIKYLLAQPKFKTTLGYGIDFFITANALNGGFKVLSQKLGKKLDKPAFPHQKRMFLEVSQSAMFVTRTHLLDSINSNSPATLIRPEVNDDCGIDEIEQFPHKRSLPRLFKKLRKEFKGNESQNRSLLGELYPFVGKVIYSDEAEFTAELWADVLSKLLLTCYSPLFDDKNIPTVSSVLLPIYRRRSISFWLGVKGLDPLLVEEMLRRQAKLVFQKLSKQNIRSI